MVDVSNKAQSTREATATATVRSTAEVLSLLGDGELPKGDALAVARIAGIMAAKKTPDLIPLCHPLPIAKVTIDFELDADSVTVFATVKTRGVTGVEMEALTAASVAALSVYDMIKAVDKHAVLTDIKSARQKRRQERGLDPMNMPEPHRHGEATGRKAGVVIASTRAASGIYEDLTGPVIIDWLTEHGFEPFPAMVVPDGAPVGAALRALLSQQPAVIITSGGTGLSPTDATPEQTLPLLDREIPGIMEGIRNAGMAKTPMAMLSRGHAGAAGQTFIVNLPGSPKGVMDGLSVLDPIVGHLCDQLEGSHGH